MRFLFPVFKIADAVFILSLPVVHLAQINF